METMYDRLGDLLNETLEAGEIKFVKVEVEQKNTENPQKDSDTIQNNVDEGQARGQEDKTQENKSQTEAKDNPRTNHTDTSESHRPEYHRPENTGTIYHAEDFGTESHTQAYKPRSFIYKKITPELEKAYKLLDVPFSSSLEDLKKAYKDKLKYYHPDRHADNETLQKVATDKTRQVVEAYNLIVKFLED